MLYANPRLEQSVSRTVRTFFTAGLTAVFLGFAGDVSAAVRTWTGLGGTGNWSTSGNWDTGTPGNNDSVVFINGTANFLTTNNFVGRTLASITFSGSGSSMNIRGQAITLTGGISASQTGGAATCDLDITLATNSQTIAVSGAGAGSALTLSGDLNLNGLKLTVNVTDSGTVLVCSGAISGAGNITRNTGAGSLWFSGSTANTYSGITTVNSGFIFATKSSGVISIPGDVVIGNGSATDTLQLGNDNQIAATADISIRTGGVFDLNNQSNTVASVSQACAMRSPPGRPSSARRLATEASNSCRYCCSVARSNSTSSGAVAVSGQGRSAASASPAKRGSPASRARVKSRLATRMASVTSPGRSASSRTTRR